MKIIILISEEANFTPYFIEENTNTRVIKVNEGIDKLYNWYLNA